MTREQLRALYPWIPPVLFDVFYNAWVETGDARIALDIMRQDPRYDSFYPGNRRDDGTLRYDEATYQATVESFQTTLLGAGLNPQVFADRMPDLIAGNVSPVEFQARVAAIFERVALRSDLIRSEFARLNPSVGAPTDAAIFAMALDPNIEQAVINQRITVAEIGASAFRRGFTLSIPQAQALIEVGLTEQPASQLFAQAQDLVPIGTKLAERHNDPDDDFSLDDFLAAFALGDQFQRARAFRLLRSEASLFTGQVGPERAATGAVVGLEAQ